MEAAGLSDEIVKLGGGMADEGAFNAFGVVGDSGSSIVGAGGCIEDVRGGGGGLSSISGTVGVAACWFRLAGGVDGATAGTPPSSWADGSAIVGIFESLLLDADRSALPAMSLENHVERRRGSHVGGRMTT